MKLLMLSKLLVINIILTISLTFYVFLNGGVAINEDGSDPDPSAILDVKSTNKGLLIPRMNTVQRSNINNPSEGLLVFLTDGETGINYYSGGNWKSLNGSGTTTNKRTYETTGPDYSETIKSDRNTWLDSPVNIKVPENGTYLIIWQARLFFTDKGRGWRHRLYNVSQEKELGIFYGHNRGDDSSQANGSGDTGSIGTLISTLTVNDNLRIEYFVQGQGSQGEDIYLGNENGAQAIHLIRLSD